MSTLKVETRNQRFQWFSHGEVDAVFRDAGDFKAPKADRCRPSCDIRHCLKKMRRDCADPRNVGLPSRFEIGMYVSFGNSGSSAERCDSFAVPLQPFEA